MSCGDLDNLVPVDILTGWIRHNYSGFLPLGTFIAFYRFSKLFSEFAQPREIVVKLSINKEHAGWHYSKVFSVHGLKAIPIRCHTQEEMKTMSKKSITLQKQWGWPVVRNIILDSFSTDWTMSEVFILFLLLLLTESLQNASYKFHRWVNSDNWKNMETRIPHFVFKTFISKLKQE